MRRKTGQSINFTQNTTMKSQSTGINTLRKSGTGLWQTELVDLSG
jgi:hypothetical protein